MREGEFVDHLLIHCMMAGEVWCLLPTLIKIMVISSATSSLGEVADLGERER